MGSTGRVVLTPRGKQKLEQELDHLRTTGRDEIAAFMQSIMEEGDISENSGYDDARAKMGALESRINELEDLLAKAVVVEENREVQVINIGATVEVTTVDGKQWQFVIVGTHEVDTRRRHISDDSPIGKALLGRRAGERVYVPTPRGEVEYLIQAVFYE